MAPDWDKLGDAVTTDTLMIAKVDCTVEKKVSSMMKIRGFPTLYLFDSGLMYEYNGARSYDELQAFATGGFKSADTKALPWNESFVDVAKEQVLEYFQRGIAIWTARVYFVIPKSSCLPCCAPSP